MYKKLFHYLQKVCITFAHVAPNVTVTVTVNPVNGLVIAGKMVSINCMNTGADSLEATFDFELIAEDNRTVMHYQEDTRDAQVVYTSKARASDAGKYVCKVTVDSDFLDAPITSMSTAVTLTVQRKPICYMNLREEYLICNKLLVLTYYTEYDDSCLKKQRIN